MNIFWFRRDLRLEDNIGFQQACLEGETLPIFIFDENIIEELPKNDARITFIYDVLLKINEELKNNDTGISIFKGKPLQLFAEIIQKYPIKKVFLNRDYEPYAQQRDEEVISFLKKQGVEVHAFQDHVIMEPNEVLKADGNPYTVYTPYKNTWLKMFQSKGLPKMVSPDLKNTFKFKNDFPTLEELGFEHSAIKVKPFDLSIVEEYHQGRDFPAQDATSYLSPHLRFGTISIRDVIRNLKGNYGKEGIFLSELIWREFFIQIMVHFPNSMTRNFRSKYDGIKWRNDESDFEKWCNGKTGYPIVDAGMRQLNQTGYMHNRVRMVVASFLCKHLLIDWRWGEAYFAQKLLDFELASNVGNWQWAAGTGCDAAPYFRVFNPTEQTKKFDPKLEYISKWVPEINDFTYPEPMVEHKFARERAIQQYKEGIESSNK